MAELLQNFRAEALKQWADNQRFRLGVVAVGILLLAQVLILFLDFVDAVAMDVASAREDFRERQQIAGQVEWLERKIASTDLRLAQEERLWRAATPGLGAANFQDWLQQSAQKSGLPRVKIRIQGTESVQPQGLEYELRKIEAEIMAVYNAVALEKFLFEIASSGRILRVSQLQASSKAPSRIRMLLTTYVQLSVPGGDA